MIALIVQTFAALIALVFGAYQVAGVIDAIVNNGRLPQPTRLVKNVVLFFLTMEIESERIERRRRGEPGLRGQIFGKFWERLVDVVTLRALRGPSIQTREAMMRRRTIEGGKPLDPMDTFWREDRAETDVFINDLERKLKRAEWAKFSVAQPYAEGADKVLVAVPHPSQDDVCAWGRYHDPDFDRCECWDPGQ